MQHDDAYPCKLFLGLLIQGVSSAGVATLFKEEYKRYSVQLPEELSKWVEQRCKDTGLSGSQVIVDAVRRGATAEPQARIHALYDDELALLDAAKLALKVAGSTGPVREDAVRELLAHLLTAGLRRPSADRMVAEPKAEYKTATPEKPPDNPSRISGAGPRHRVSKSA